MTTTPPSGVETTVEKTHQRGLIFSSFKKDACRLRGWRRKPHI